MGDNQNCISVEVDKAMRRDEDAADEPRPSSIEGLGGAIPKTRNVRLKVHRCKGYLERQLYIPNTSTIVPIEIGVCIRGIQGCLIGVACKRPLARAICRDGCTFTPCSINSYTSLKLAHQSSSTRLQNARATRSRHRTSAQLKCGIGVRQQQHARAMRLSRLRLAETRPIIGRVEAG